MVGMVFVRFAASHSIFINKLGPYSFFKFVSMIGLASAATPGDSKL